MTTENSNIRRLWGHDFRVVPDGLSEPDVALFVEQLMAKYQASLEKSSHIEPLHQLARKAVAEAERLAAEIKERSEEESQRRSAEVVSQAEHSGQEIIDRALAAANAIDAEARREAQEKVSELENTFFTMSKWAEEEFEALKGLDQRTRVFLSAYESFLNLLKRGVESEPAVDEAPAISSDRPSAESGVGG